MLANHAEAVRILGIAGSGRSGSFNGALLAAAKRLLPDGATLETYDVSRFPLYNTDLERSMPQQVGTFKEKIRKADAILFAAPEYNHSISAVMKNALEWGNRPWGDNSWDGKPAAIISASTSITGGARAQEHLRQVMVDLNMLAMNQPQVLVANAREKFSPSLELIDEKTRELTRDLLAQLVKLVRTTKALKAEQAQLVRI